MKIKTSENMKKEFNYVQNLNERFLIEELKDYLYQSDFDAYHRICLLYGLRRTGKTTMIFQTIHDMSEEQKNQSVFLQCEKTDYVGSVIDKIEDLIKNGYKYFFVDEVTEMEDFIDSSNLFSDWLAAGGVRIVLSGTDSLSLWLSTSHSLFDRATMIHTTYIPFYEFQYLFPKANIDDFIEYGGTLSHENNGLGIFQNPELANRYIDEAICDNILKSLRNNNRNYTYSKLEEFYTDDEIKNLIHRIIKSDNHAFVKNIVLKKFKIDEYVNTAKNLQRRPEEKFRLLAKEMNENDKTIILKYFKEKINVFDKHEKENPLAVTDEIVYSLKKYLENLDFVTKTKSVMAKEIYSDKEKMVFHSYALSQPGIRYSEAKLLCDSILDYYLKNNKQTNNEKDIRDEILNCVKGGLLEDLITVNCQRTLPDDYEVLKVMFDKNFGIVEFTGEFDMVIRDKNSFECHLFEIKHDTGLGDWQTKHLLDNRKTNWVEQRFGKVKSKVVLYNGMNISKDDRGIIYKNCTEFLNELKEFDRNYQRHIERVKDACVQCLDDPFYVDKKGLKRSFEENGMEYTMVVWEENPNQYEIYDDANNLVENGVIEELDREDLKKRAKQLVKKMDERER